MRAIRSGFGHRQKRKDIKEAKKLGVRLHKFLKDKKDKKDKGNG